MIFLLFMPGANIWQIFLWMGTSRRRRSRPGTGKGIGCDRKTNDIREKMRYPFLYSRDVVGADRRADHMGAGFGDGLLVFQVRRGAQLIEHRKFGGDLDRTVLV